MEATSSFSNCLPATDPAKILDEMDIQEGIVWHDAMNGMLSKFLLTIINAFTAIVKFSMFLECIS